MKTPSRPFCRVCNQVHGLATPSDRSGVGLRFKTARWFQVATPSELRAPDETGSSSSFNHLFVSAGWLAGLVISFCLAAALETSAQPVNDECSGAIAMALDTIYRMNTATATSTNDPTQVCGGPFGRSVWFSLTPPQNGMVTLSTCGSDFDTAFQIYTGTCTNLASVLCSDDLGPACPTQQASASFLVYSNVTYFVVVGGYGGASGNLQIVATMPRLPNDECSGAIPLKPGVPVAMNTANATTTNDPVPPCAYGFTSGVWFSFTPSNTDLVTISTAGSDLQTAMAIYTGSCGNLSLVDCTASRSQFFGTNGSTYFILAGGVNGAPGGNIRVMAVEGTPANDDCSGAIPMTEGVTYTTDALGATDDKPPAACFHVPGVWYSFTPTADSIVTVSACGSDPVGTTLQVFSGNCTSLAAVVDGCTDFGVCSNNAAVAFRGSAGVTYRILATCNGILNIRATTASIAPNDTCAGAIVMAEGVTYTADTTHASSDGDTNSCYSGPGRGVWYTFTPAQTSIVSVSTCGSGFWTALQVFSGVCGALGPVVDGCNAGFGPVCTGYQASVSFKGNAGSTYRILAGGAYGAAGNLSIRATTAPVLPNDICSEAIAMTEAVTYTADTTRASSDGDTNSCYSGLGRGVWYNFTPAQTSIVSVSTCGSDFRTALQVFSGVCGALAPVIDGCNAGFGPVCTGYQASVSFKGSAGSTYHILAAGVEGAAGNLSIRTTTAPLLSNDTCSGAIAMAEAVTYAADTTRASSDGDYSDCYPYLGRGVWYTFTPAVDGVVTVSTCGSDFDTVLQVFTGSCGSLADIVDGCNDNAGPACGGAQASVRFKGTAGVTYRILAGGVNRAAGNLRITANVGPLLPNDDCSGAVPMTQGVVYTQSTTNATSGFRPKDVWYKFTPATNCIVTISTCGSDYSPELSIFYGTDCQSLYSAELIPSVTGPACPTGAPYASFRGLAGSNYWIQVWSGSGAGGTLDLQATVSPALVNDDCSGAVPLVVGQVYSESTATATSQGDPFVFYGSLTKGVWFSLTPRVSDTVTISTCGSDFDTILEVYSGSCGSLVPITTGFGHFDKPPCDQGGATAIFSATANTTYLIVVGGFNGITGNLKISASLPPPGNSSFAGAIPLVANRTNTINTTYAVSTNHFIPDCGTAFSNGVWFTFVAPTDSQVTLDTCASDFPTVLEVYTGDYPSLQPLACNAGNGPACSNNRASLSFLAVTGTRYAILAGGQGGASGNLSILAHVPPPPNAFCSGAIPLSNGIRFSMNTTSALSLGDWLPTCRTNFGDAVWFSYKPPSDGPISISTCGSDFDTVLQVYNGTCAALVPLACNDDSGPVCASSRASVSFIASAQTNYLILVGGNAGAGGNLNITATRLAPPANQDCASAIPMLTGVPYGGNTFDAPMPKITVPVCQTNFGHALWYTFTPQVSGLVGVSTCGSDFDTVLQVFTGDCRSLVPVDGGCNDDAGPFCDSVNASVVFRGTAGTKYWVLVGGFGTNWGNLEISAGVLPPMSPKLDHYYFTLSWPTNVGDIHIEFTTNLAPPVVWTPWSYYTQGTNSVAPAYLDYLGPKGFFRLRP